MAGVELTNTKPEGQLTDEDVASVISAFKVGVREAQLVPDSVLDKIHKDFKQHFRGEYQKSLELRIRSVEEHKPALEDEGRTLATNWSNWLNSHKTEMHEPE